MDRNTHEKADIAQLIHLSALSRRVLSAETNALRHKLDFPNRVRESLKENPSKWLMGSLSSGLVASMFFKKKRTKEAPKKHRGLVFTLLGLSVSALQPLARIWLTNQLKQYLSTQRLPLGVRPPQR